MERNTFSFEQIHYFQVQYFGNASLTYQAKAVSKEETYIITPDKLSRISNNCIFPIQSFNQMLHITEQTFNKSTYCMKIQKYNDWSVFICICHDLILVSKYFFY